MLTPPPGVEPEQRAPQTAQPPQTPQPPRPRQEQAGPARTPAADESGPMFLDEDDDGSDQPAQQQGGDPQSASPRWAADASRQSDLGEQPRRVSWGQRSEADQSSQSSESSQPSQPSGSAQASAEPRLQAQGGRGDRGAAPSTQEGRQQWQPDEQQPEPWAQQVRRLARPQPQPQPPQPRTQRSAPQPGAGAGSDPQHVLGQTFGDNALAWRPPVSNPFLSAAQQQARPAPLGRRLIARLIDAIVVGAVCGAAAVPLASGAVEHLRDKIDQVRLRGETVQVWLIDGTTGGHLAIFAAVVLIVGFLYEVLPTARWGRTLGKRLVQVRVLDMEDQEPPTLGNSLRRWLVYQVLGLIAVGILNVLWCLLDRPWRQCWHDKAARTFVATDVSEPGLSAGIAG